MIIRYRFLNLAAGLPWGRVANYELEEVWSVDAQGCDQTQKGRFLGLNSQDGGARTETWADFPGRFGYATRMHIYGEPTSKLKEVLCPSISRRS